MGNLHEGHLELVDAALEKADEAEELSVRGPNLFGWNPGFWLGLLKETKDNSA